MTETILATRGDFILKQYVYPQWNTARYMIYYKSDLIKSLHNDEPAARALFENIDITPSKYPKPIEIYTVNGFCYGSTRTLNYYLYSNCVVAHIRLHSYVCMIIKTKRKYLAYETGRGQCGNLRDIPLLEAIDKIKKYKENLKFRELDSDIEKEIKEKELIKAI